MVSGKYLRQDNPLESKLLFNFLGVVLGFGGGISWAGVLYKGNF